ncbi:MAG: sulfur oxidation c-type cytochrome SoxX [Gammaproteobacteria bacterium]|nr:sulfur oxidation c-type cytochrome SoxX [Gammaproteobacteria bacterium]
MQGATAAEGPSAPNYEIKDYAIPSPLTSSPGSPERGRAVILERELGNCLACHAIPLDAEFPGSVGPPLAGVGARLTPAQLRLRVVDSKVLNPASAMPAYFRSSGLNRVQAEYVGKTILTAQQVEDVVAFLATLK